MLLVACFVEITIKPQIFTFLLAESNSHVSAFRLVICNVLFSIIYFSIYKFCAKKIKFRLSRFCFSDSNFQDSVGKFPFLRFRFSGFNFLSFCWQVPTFTLQFFVCLLSDSNFPTSAGDSNFHASALKTFGGNNC